MFGVVSGGLMGAFNPLKCAISKIVRCFTLVRAHRGGK